MPVAAHYPPVLAGGGYLLTEAEVALLVRICRDHEVAFCDKCQKRYRLSELGSDIIVGDRFDRCGQCQTNVKASVRAHLQDCPLIHAELIEGRYEDTAKRSQQLVDASHVQIAESRERIQYRLNAGICMACRKVIQPGQGLYQFPAGGYHVHCFEEVVKKKPAP